ncbi:hypothetical protein HO173_010120 [Letharia columbiana]|uniref:Uncharacterized protein n=1 Tax=Letharia columbiana TaxID=112416 RepID=A0A8H6L151_9LECA|nr:uncharacterized protein HO173_010120 [Letharia columbiana]KAF6231588.1 hypothetical protein HO173_010120 [Letharia columbiana]
MTSPKDEGERKITKAGAGVLGAQKHKELQSGREAGEGLAPLSTRPNKRRAEDSDTMSVGSSRASKPKAGLSKKRRRLDLNKPGASDSGSPRMLSENPSLKSASKGSKMTDVLSEANRPKVLPKHLPGLKSSDDQVHLPAVLTLRNGTTITLTYERTAAQASERTRTSGSR